MLYDPPMLHATHDQMTRAEMNLSISFRHETPWTKTFLFHDIFLEDRELIDPENSFWPFLTSVIFSLCRARESRVLVALTLCVWVGVLSTLLSNRSDLRWLMPLNFKFASIYMFLASRTHLQYSLNPFFEANLIFDVHHIVIQKFHTTSSGSSRYSILLRIAQN